MGKIIIKKAKKIRKRPLSPQQELFCRYYATERDYFGNGTLSYARAYNIDLTKRGAVKVAGAAAARLLGNVSILDRTRELMKLEGFNDETVDKELLFLMKQDSELSTKLGAIREYNQLQNRIQKKIDLTSKGEKIGFGLAQLLGTNSDAESPETNSEDPD